MKSNWKRISALVLSLALLLAVSSTLAYGMAQYRFRGKGFLHVGYDTVGILVPCPG